MIYCTTSQFILVNLALKKPSFQSTTLAKGEAKYGNDGNRSTRCATGKNGPYQWWSVDLKEVVSIEKVVLHLSSSAFYQGRYTRLNISATTDVNDIWTQCNSIPNPSTLVISLTCVDETLARHVKVLQDEQLFLVEVEVYGKVVPPGN